MKKKFENYNQDSTFNNEERNQNINLNDAIFDSFEGFYEVLYKTGLTEDVRFFVKSFTEYLKLKEKNGNDNEDARFKIYNHLSSILKKMRAYHMDLENLSKMEKIAQEKLDKIEQEESLNQ